MSLILDALRKSEAERQRGQAPNLYAAIPTSIRRRSTPAWLWPTVVVGLLAALLLWQLWPSGPRTVSETRPSRLSAAASTSASPSPSAVQPRSVMTAPPPTSSPAPPPARVADLPAPATAKPENELPAAPIAVPLAPSQEQTETIDNASDDDSATLPRLADLPAETRAVLPPLKLSMHVWSQRPEGRFAIVDGQRVGEGSRVGAAVVQEIRRNGVVLDIDGRAYWLPRP